MNDTLLHYEYNITDDPGFIYEMFDVPPEVQRMFESLHPKALKGREGKLPKCGSVMSWAGKCGNPSIT